MLKSATTARLRTGTGRAAGILSAMFFAVAAFHAETAAAVEMTTLYTAEVNVDRQQSDPRAVAYRAALDAVLMRVAGSGLASNTSLVDELFPRPSDYVVQFRPGAEDTLSVSFDGEALERVLRDAGQTVWGRDRPLTLIWLAVDWGDGEREILGADDAVTGIDAARSIDRNRLLRERLLDAAGRRGLPVVFPLLDTDDLKSVRFSDIWGGFDEQLLEASRRYDVDSVLVGRVRPDSSQLNRWSYYFGDRLQAYSGEPEAVMNLVADSLADEFAIQGGAAIETVELGIAGIESVSAYGTVGRLLEGLPVVERASIVSVEGDRIEYRVEAVGGVERLRRALRFSGLIEQDERYVTQPLLAPGVARLEFFFSP